MAERHRILVVDDNAFLRTSLVQNLCALGYEAQQAACGNEALPLFQNTQYHLILLDLRMPYIDGFEVLKHVKGVAPGTKVIIITAYADLTSVQKCRGLGADDVIPKPFNLEYLFYIIKNVLRKGATARPAAGAAMA
jgi:DNA-binding response OmpR family regulator